MNARDWGKYLCVLKFSIDSELPQPQNQKPEKYGHSRNRHKIDRLAVFLSEPNESTSV